MRPFLGSIWPGFALGLIVTAALPAGILMIVDAVDPPRDRGCSRRVKAMADLRGIEEALDLFQRATGRLPSNEEGLAALVPEYLDRVPIDPWGSGYAYVLDAGAPRVMSYGADGRPGGVGFDEDVTNDWRTDGRPCERGRLIPDAVARALLFGSVLVVPAVALRVRGRPAWTVGAIAAASTLIGIVLVGLALVSAPGGNGGGAAISLGLGLMFSTGAAAVLMRVRYSDGIVVAAIALLVGGLWIVSGMIAR